PPEVNVPMGLARFVAWFSELRARFAGRTPLLSRAALAMGSLDIVVDASKARTALGWSPRPLEDRLRETMAWYVEIYRVRGAPPFASRMRRHRVTGPTRTTARRVAGKGLRSIRRSRGLPPRRSASPRVDPDRPSRSRPHARRCILFRSPSNGLRPGGISTPGS